MTVLLWAGQGRPPETIVLGFRTVVLWQTFLPEDAPEGWSSIPQSVMDHRDDYVSRFRAGLHHLSEKLAPVTGLDGLDYWWLTLPADFSLEPDSPASIIVRILALGDILSSLDVTRVEVRGASPELQRALKVWARDSGQEVAFADERPERSSWRRRIYRALPVLAGLRALVAMWPSPRRHGIAQELAGLPSDGIVVVDYLAQLRGQTALPLVFDSGYWGPLVDVLRESGEPVTWLHNSADFATRSVVARDDAVVSALDRPDTRERHLLTQTALTAAGLVSAVWTWIRIRVLFRTVRRGVKSSTAFGFEIWPVIATSMRDTYLGRTALINAVWITQFQKLLFHLPRQSVGLLLLEGQPWELAFAHAWKSAGHGKLVGFCHVPVSPWNTRLLKDPRTARHTLPLMPDAVVVTSARMRDLFIASGYRSDQLLEAEALRFMHLGELQGSRPTRDQDQVLVLGEYSESLDEALRSVVTEAVQSATTPLSLFYRPHPTRRDAPIEQFLTRDESPTVQAALSQSRAAICGPTSSTALEAAAMGILTLVVPDPRALNASPAEGLTRTHYVSSGLSLARALMEFEEANLEVSREGTWIEPGVPRWRTHVSSWFS